MEFVGEYLKKSRLNKKINLTKVSKDLNISIDFLKNIESDNFTGRMDQVYILGHVRSYARYLNLDQKEVIQNYKIQVSFSIENTLNELPKPIETFSLFSISKSVSMFSVLIISLSFYFLFVQPNDLQSDYAITPDIPENMQMSLEKIEMDIALEKKLNNKEMINSTKKIDKIVSDVSRLINEKSLIKQKPIEKSSISAIASKPDENELQEFKNIVTLRFLNPTWIQIRDKKDKIILSQLMNKEDEYSYSIADNLLLTLGNAGNVMILIDNEIRGKVGKVGEVIDSLIIDSQFYN